MKTAINDAIISEYAEHYKPLITFSQAAAIAQVAVATIYDWSSRGLLNSFKSKRGRGCLLIRDEFVRFIQHPETFVSNN